MRMLEGKIALITGGNSGIGRSAALAFAREGAKVVIAARNTARGMDTVREIERGGDEALFVATDVSKAGAVVALVQAVVEKFGRLDCAFNNAGELGNLVVTSEVREDEFDRLVAINLKGVWLCMKYEILQMLQQDPPGGTIVNTSSINGLGGVPKGSIYATTKAGVLALTKSAALEYATAGIRVNALVAGAFHTPMRESEIERASGGDAKKREEIESRYEERIAVRRIGRPEEAAQAVVWLCSNAASYVTGHSMIVDGGWSASMR